MYEITVQHTTDTGHRVAGHFNPDGTRGKCSRLHGHTYGYTVRVGGAILDETGFVLDYGVVKAALDEWDHKLLLWEEDGIFGYSESSFFGSRGEWADEYGIVTLPFNPTAENMARALAEKILVLDDGVMFCTVEVRETPKTSAVYTARHYLPGMDEPSALNPDAAKKSSVP